MRPRRLITALRGSFLTGLVVVAPAVLTIWLITSVVEFIDAKVLPLVPAALVPQSLQDIQIPGLGVVVFLVFTLVVGWLAKGLIGRSIIGLGEDIVARMPVVRSIYNGLKQIAETVLSKSDAKFDRACLVQYPRPGLWAIAFISTRTRGEIAARIGTPTVSVFLPTTPNPTSGFLLFVPESDVIELDMSVEDAAKLVISAGLVSPDTLPAARRKGQPQRSRASVSNTDRPEAISSSGKS
jgi:uncharacterized membrane protein